MTSFAYSLAQRLVKLGLALMQKIAPGTAKPLADLVAKHQDKLFFLGIGGLAAATHWLVASAVFYGLQPSLAASALGSLVGSLTPGALVYFGSQGVGFAVALLVSVFGHTFVSFYPSLAAYQQQLHQQVDANKLSAEQANSAYQHEIRRRLAGQTKVGLGSFVLQTCSWLVLYWLIGDAWFWLQTGVMLVLIALVTYLWSKAMHQQTPTTKP